MQDKRGISQVATVLIFLMIALVAIAIIWATVDRVILGKTSKLSLSSLTLDLEIESAKINTSTKIATVKVARNPGEGKLRSIKFIIEDDENAIVREKIVEGEFPELSKRTFYINLADEFIDIGRIKSISIAPVYYAGSDEIETIGKVTDVIGNLETNFGEEESGSGEGEGQFCDESNPCPDSGWTGISRCDVNGDVVQPWEDITCGITNVCLYSYSDKIRTDCLASQTCYDSPSGASCLDAQISCTIEPDDPICGSDSYGALSCATSPERIVQMFIDYSCSGGFCTSSNNLITTSTCQGTDVCFEDPVFGPECVTAPECLNHQDCWNNPLYGMGYVCETGLCVQEQPTQEGTVFSAWPFNVGEYFDSNDFPYQQEITFDGQYVIFTTSSDETPETRCLKITDYNYFEGSIPYVRTNETITNVSAGDHFQVWETVYGCTHPLG